jgi:hypothetical protein
VTFVGIGDSVSSSTDAELVVDSIQFGALNIFEDEVWGGLNGDQMLSGRRRNIRHVQLLCRNQHVPAAKEQPRLVGSTSFEMG